MDKPIGAELASRPHHVRDQACQQQPISPPLSRQHSRDRTYNPSIGSSPAFRTLAMAGKAVSPWNQPSHSLTDAAAATHSRMFMSAQPDGLTNGTQLARLPAWTRPNPVEDPVDSSLITSFFSRYQQIQLVDQDKNALIKDMFRHIESLESKLRKSRLGGPIGADYRYGQVSRQHSLEDSNSYVLVLIDGFSTPFAQEYYAAGFSGGEIAAKALFGTMQQLVDSTLGDNLSAKPSLKVTIYDNMSSFDQSVPIIDFVRGFNSVFDAVEIIDGGSATATAGKVAKSLRHHYTVSQCHRILFGGADVPKYADILRSIIASDPTFAHHVNLLAVDGIHIEQTLRSLGIQKLTRPFDTDGASLLCRRGSSTTDSSAPMVDASISLTSSAGSWVMPTAHCEENSIAQNSRAPALAGTPSSVTPTPTTWASTVARAKPGNTTAPVTSKKPDTTIHVEGDPTIPRNRRGERIDPLVPHSKEYVDRIKRKKLCNVHFLRQECPYGIRCTHIHDYKPTREELRTLAHVARMAPCVNGSKCEDAKCIYGHICPAPENGKRGQLCVFGDNCKFPPEMHNVDRTAVTVLQIGKH